MKDSPSSTDRRPVKVSQFQVIHFMSMNERTGKDAPAIILYALGNNGTVYELSGGKWTAFPIIETTHDR